MRNDASMPRRFVWGNSLAITVEFGSAGDVYGGTGFVTLQMSSGQIQNALILFEIDFADKSAIYFFRVSNSETSRAFKMLIPNIEVTTCIHCHIGITYRKTVTYFKQKTYSASRTPRLWTWWQVWASNLTGRLPSKCAYLSFANGTCIHIIIGSCSSTSKSSTNGTCLCFIYVSRRRGWGKCYRLPALSDVEQSAYRTLPTCVLVQLLSVRE